MIKIQRLNGNVKESIFCVDDCIATFSEEHKLIYQAMYFDEWIIDVQQVGDDYKLFFLENAFDNLKEYGGIIIEQINPSDHMLKDLEELLDFSNVIMLEIKGIECPWDWRYHKIDWGNHTFLLIGRDKNLLIGMDPYYEFMHVELSKKQLMSGYVQARALYKGIPNEKKLFENACIRFKSVKSFSDRYELFKKCFDQRALNRTRAKLINGNCFDDYNIENSELIQSLQNCEYSRLRFAILLQYFNENHKFSPLLETCIRDYLNIADIWGRVRNVSIKTLISGANNNEKIEVLIRQVCEMEDNAIIKVKKYFNN